jgi:preprotein translocase subunit SecG
MEQLGLIVYVLLSAGIVGLILLQQGKGADAGASFGSGASQTVFGSAGSGNVLTRATAVLATLFFLGSIGLAVMAKHKSEAALRGVIEEPAAVETPQIPALPAGNSDVSVSGGDVPNVGSAPTATDAGARAAGEVPTSP